MQYDLISILHLVLCLAFLVYIGCRMRLYGGLTLFHTGCFAYCALGLTFYPLVATDPWTIVNAQTIWRGFMMALIFVSLCTCADLLFYRRKYRPRSTRYLPRQPSLLLLGGVYLFGLIGFLRFYFVAGGVRHVGEVLTAVRDGVEYYDARGRVADELMREPGSGVAWGTSAVYQIMPILVVLGFFVYRQTHNKAYLALAVLSIVQALLTVLVVMERGPMLFVITFPMVAWLTAGYRRKAKRTVISRKKLLSFGIGGGAFVALAMFVYSWTNVGENPLWSLFNRVFVAPCITTNYYLATFPDVFGFRGWSKIFQMGATLGEAEVGTRDIYSFLTFGRFFSNPNSGILSTAYSGAGLWGCAMITVLFLAIVTTIDRAFRRLPTDYLFINVLINLYGIAILVNAPIVAALSGGFALPSLILLAYLALCRRRRVTNKGEACERSTQADESALC